MPVKLKKGSKEAKAHMAKIRAMRGSGAGKHTDTKSHNVNIRVVSGNIGSLPFTGKILGVNITAKNYENGVEIITGINRNLYFASDIKSAIVKRLVGSIVSQRTVKEYDEKKLTKTISSFIDTLKAEIKKPIKKIKSAPKKETTTKSATSTRQTGFSNKIKDEMKKAKAPGKRKSATGKTYYERRANRSDKPGSLTGMHKNAPPVYTQTIKLNQSQINDALHQYERWHVLLNNYKNDLKIEKDPTWKKFYANEIKQINAVCKSLKSHINSLKKVK